MKSYAYFPGCSMDSTAVTYKKSFEYIAEKIGLELKEIPDWSCCGSTAAHTKNEMMALSLAARNIAIAEEKLPGLDIVTPCAACFSRLRYANWAARKDELIRKEIQSVIAMEYQAKPEILNFLDLFSDPEIREKITSSIKHSLKGLKIACYYGCLMSRPREVTGETDPENPMKMDEIISLTGAEPVIWDYKTECCGASHQVDAPEAARELIDRIFRNAKANQADAIVTACPLCNMNLDMREAEINKNFGRKYNIPVFQFTEMIAVAMGASASECGIHQHFFPAFDVINETLKRNREKAEKLPAAPLPEDPLKSGPVIIGKAGK
ncbi:MAG: CoB--CoM heterodisulfide reductase iron-sulfur subunit B family protein [Parasporobacterium sp.]|nr:CoB--CoM heterodisulfide reductase iron-sulfur subunit B family protein [Parasporobacterium sp.]